MHTRKFKILLELSAFGALAGIIYQLLDEKLVTIMSVIVGIPIALGFGVLELFIFSGLQPKLNKLSFLQVILVKSTAYTAVFYFVESILSLLAGLSQGKQMPEFYQDILSTEKFILLFYTLIFYAFLVFYLQVNRLPGEGILIKFLKGKYRRPTEEERIFMFLDVKSSTNIAEKLGHERYYSFLNDFFHEISIPVLKTKGEIYQYVGDEVVFTWETKHGFEDSNCLRIFYEIKNKVKENRDFYQSEYGVVPEFKAGVHYGKVISAQIGDIKREIVYNGDVLNTTSRIQEQCNKFDSELLVSGELLKKLPLNEIYKAKKVDTVKLRGKENDIDIYNVLLAMNS